MADISPFCVHAPSSLITFGCDTSLRSVYSDHMSRNSAAVAQSVTKEGNWYLTPHDYALSNAPSSLITFGCDTSLRSVYSDNMSRNSAAVAQSVTKEGNWYLTPHDYALSNNKCMK